MTEQEIHDWIQERLDTPRQTAEPKPSDVNKEKWKNRHKISAKLHKDTYDDFMRWSSLHDLTVNQAINVVLSLFFSKVTSK